MVGSSFGWVEAPYVACPARARADRGKACVAMRDGRVHIVPGLSCRNRLDAPDVLRGEETQILGALAGDSGARRGTLLCLPGTHTKWVLLEDGHGARNSSPPSTGELFALLKRHSVLVAGQARV